MSAQDALLKYSQKQLKTARTRKRRNKKPEEEAVREICTWCEKQKWSVHRVESKAVYSRAAGRYLRGQAASGFPDLVGNTGHGQGVFIEVKAKGKRSTIKPHQVIFLKEKIKTGCFAICADSAVCINNMWTIYCSLNNDMRKKYLLDNLPKSGS